MPITSRKIGLGALAVVSAVALLAGCAAAPTKSNTTAKSKYLPCIVGDTGGFSDHSFNELSLDGVIQASKAINSSYKKVASAASSDLAPGIASLIAQKCNIIVTPGFDFEQPDTTAAKANPKTDFAIIDDNTIQLPNVKDVVFETDEAAFIGGYIAASYSKTGVVATWGGAQYPSVTIYEDGIADGIAYYNQQKGKSVKLLGWDIATQKGTFIGDFSNQALAKTDTQNFLNQHADVIIPVAGSLYQGAAAAIRSSNSDAVLEGVDADVFKTDPTYGDLMLVSILKNLNAPVAAVIEASSKSKTFDNSLYVGTLKNGGVGISSFHNFASKVDPGLAAEITTIKKGIIDGSITVTSPSSFNK
ncbi:MAG TPA: BMP family ABC transporter substrate-binding protein [Galbitalea sp.]|nr:BMP family ABC transporter substrate-binding protein [Galbitalea sp.]